MLAPLYGRSVHLSSLYQLNMIGNVTAAWKRYLKWKPSPWELQSLLVTRYRTQTLEVREETIPLPVCYVDNMRVLGELGRAGDCWVSMCSLVQRCVPLNPREFVGTASVGILASSSEMHFRNESGHVPDYMVGGLPQGTRPIDASTDDGSPKTPSGNLGVEVSGMEHTTAL